MEDPIEFTKQETEPAVVADETNEADAAGSLDESVETEEERIKRKKEELHARSVRLRRRVIPIVAISLVGVILITILLTLIMEQLQTDEDPTYRPVEYPTYEFYPVYEGNILEYERYLGYNREIYYYDNLRGYGDRYTVTENETDAKLRLIYSYLQSIINGDEDAYNGFFNQTYYQTHERQAAFEQQMLYQMRIYSYSEEYLENGEKLSTYQIDYMILMNNGTFRTDIGSDMIRSQYLVLHEYADGSVDIENLVTKRMAVKVE